jgi:hypothetical protein
MARLIHIHILVRALALSPVFLMHACPVHAAQQQPRRVLHTPAEPPCWCKLVLRQPRLGTGARTACGVYKRWRAVGHLWCAYPSTMTTTACRSLTLLLLSLRLITQALGDSRMYLATYNVVTSWFWTFYINICAGWVSFQVSGFQVSRNPENVEKQ